MRGPQINSSLVIAVVALFVALSGTALAATSTFELRSGSGSATATVDSAGQILTSQVSPAEFVNFGGALASGCTDLDKVPKGHALIITDVDYNFDTESAEFSAAALLHEKSCTVDLNLEATPSAAPSTVSIHLSAGAVVPGGTDVDSTCLFCSGYVEVHGYLVPASSISATVHMVRPARSRGHS